MGKRARREAAVEVDEGGTQVQDSKIGPSPGGLCKTDRENKFNEETGSNQGFARTAKRGKITTVGYCTW